MTLKKALFGLLMVSGLAQQAYAVDCSEKIKAGTQFSFQQWSDPNGYFWGTIRIDIVSGNSFAGEVIYTSHGSSRDTLSGFWSEDEVTFNRPCPACWRPAGPQAWNLICTEDGMNGYFGPGGGLMTVD